LRAVRAGFERRISLRRGGCSRQRQSRDSREVYSCPDLQRELLDARDRARAIKAHGDGPMRLLRFRHLVSVPKRNGGNYCRVPLR
jgi:hypothetical protein